MSTESVVTVSAAGQSSAGEGGQGIEEEVLGPIRVWHIIFIIGCLIIAVVVVVCCCFDFRIPRTRQEIEDNFQKRMMNKQYLRILERNPEELLKKKAGEKTRPRGGVAVTETSKRFPQTNSPTPKPKPKTTGQMRQAKPKVTSRAEVYEDDGESDPGKESEDYSPVARPRQQFGQQTPLALHPRDVLALMAQVNKKDNG